jgi:hypothetical protein
MIDWLVDDDIDTIKQGILNDDYAYLSDILMFGKAINQWSNEELIQEIKERGGFNHG